MQKHILTAFALVLAFSVASPAFAGRYDNPEDYGVQFQDGNESADTQPSIEGIASERA